VSPNGRRIAFVRGDEWGGGADIWVVNADGTNERRLTATPEGEFDPQWSPDGRFLSYSVVRPCGVRCDDWWAEIRRPDGTGTTIVVPQARRVRWSRDGRIVYEGDVNPVYSDTGSIKVGRPGRSYRTLVKLNAGVPSWSPGGRWIAYRYAGLWLVSPNGRTHKRIVARAPYGCPGAGCAGATPAWSPGGRWILYTGYSGVERAVVVVRVRVDGRGRRNVARGSLAAWAPRGNRIAFVAREGLSVVRPDRRGLRLLTRMTPPLPPVWSPDGKKVYFSYGPG